jgi:hypothetical protein
MADFTPMWIPSPYHETGSTPSSRQKYPARYCMCAAGRDSVHSGKDGVWGDPAVRSMDLDQSSVCSRCMRHRLDLVQSQGESTPRNPSPVVRRRASYSRLTHTASPQQTVGHKEVYLSVRIAVSDSLKLPTIETRRSDNAQIDSSWWRSGPSARRLCRDGISKLVNLGLIDYWDELFHNPLPVLELVGHP